MKKFFPVVLGLLIPLTGAMADSFVDEAVSFCRSKGGAYTMAEMVAEGDQYCRQVTCRRTSSDRYEIPEGAPGPEANVEATKKVCVPKSQIDGNFEPGRNSSGSSSGSSSGAQSGSQSGSQSGAQSGSQSGSQSGAQSGSQSGAQSGADGGAGGYAIVCDELTSPLTIFPGDRCWNACKPRRGFLGILGPKKEGGERASCIRCLRGQYPNANWRDMAGRGSVGVNINGVSVGTGVIQCRRVGVNGATFSHNGTVCPSGSVIVNGQVVSSGSTAVGGNGGVVISSGGTAVGGNGGVVISSGGAQGLPAICQSTRRQDQEACDLWIRNNARFQCSQGGRCIDEASVRSRYDRDCVNCGPGSRQQSTLSGIAEIAGAIAPPLAALGIGYFNSRAQIRSAEAWAGAAATGFEQCQIGQNNYYQYLAANEAPVLTPQQQAQMNCNGYQLSQFGGLGGGFGGLMGAGYSPGFIGGMMGPYGGYNPYGGMGGMMGGVMGGFQGGMAGGMMYPAGGMAGGMYPAGGFAQGISLAGGVAAGMYNGGMMAGGMYPAGGMGMAGGMYPAGGMYASGGMYNGGMMAGGMYPAGGMGGLAQGGYIAGGIGMAGGMYPAGGMGMSGGYFAAGAGGGISGGFPGGVGYPGGYPGGWGSGVGTGMGYPGAGGGYWGGAGGWGGNTGYLSQQTSNYDAMLQQRGLSYNMGQMASGGMGGYGAAGYSPMNMGGMLSGGLYAGGSFGGGFY